LERAISNFWYSNKFHLLVGFMSNPFQPFMTLVENHFDFNLARIKCLVAMIEGMLQCRSVNLALIAGRMAGSATVDSHYMRLRRFMREVAFDYGVVARLLAGLMGLMQEKQWTLILDRTNWKFGRIHINILYLAVARGSVAVPLFLRCWRIKNEVIRITSTV